MIIQRMKLKMTMVWNNQQQKNQHIVINEVSDSDEEGIPHFELAKRIKSNQNNDQFEQANSDDYISDVDSQKTENYYSCMERGEISDLEAEPIID